ncbi:hypothetical protein EJ06DRAFT_282443 [Trichodelitschia bisporula]|uniref:Uncharacterized protein n=1 Tax=Trichodelitschia bisporula TaxID=703511 RepID=A0A6G1I5T2_9PEZI|nr:hypothetical protein EJ06DRAFT_282443 [Trichodelitschia bisporula]
MPPENDPVSFSQSAFDREVRKQYNMVHLLIGQDEKARDVTYKAGYLIDFPRTINSLVKYEDRVWQAEVFAAILSQQPYFSVPETTKIRPFASVCSFEKFQAFMEEQKDSEDPIDKYMRPGESGDEQTTLGQPPTGPQGSKTREPTVVEEVKPKAASSTLDTESRSKSLPLQALGSGEQAPTKAMRHRISMPRFRFFGRRLHSAPAEGMAA